MDGVNRMSYEFTHTSYFIDKMGEVLDWFKEKGLEAHLLGVAFTTVRCLWLSDVTPQFYKEVKVITSSKISDENFNVFK